MKTLLKLIFLAAVVWVVWYLASPLFIDKEVNEDAPVAIEKPTTNLEEQVPDPEMRKKHDKMMEEAKDDGTTMEEDEPERVAVPAATFSGSFVDVAHHGSGSVDLIPQGLTSYVLRIENLDVLNGPDLRVLLSPHADVRSSDGLGEYVELGKLKGNKGNQNYAIPEGIDVTQYKSVVIYCKPFKVVFNTANLR